MKKLITLIALLSALFMGVTKASASEHKHKMSYIYDVTADHIIKGPAVAVIYAGHIYYRDRKRTTFVRIPLGAIISEVQKGKRVTIKYTGGTINFTFNSEKEAVGYDGYLTELYAGNYDPS